MTDEHEKYKIYAQISRLSKIAGENSRFPNIDSNKRTKRLEN